MCREKVLEDYIIECKELITILEKGKMTEKEKPLLDLRVMSCISVLKEYDKVGWISLPERLMLSRLITLEKIYKRISEYTNSEMIDYSGEVFHFSM